MNRIIIVSIQDQGTMETGTKIKEERIESREGDQDHLEEVMIDSRVEEAKDTSNNHVLIHVTVK